MKLGRLDHLFAIINLAVSAIAIALLVNLDVRWCFKFAEYYSIALAIYSITQIGMALEIFKQGTHSPRFIHNLICFAPFISGVSLYSQTL